MDHFNRAFSKNNNNNNNHPASGTGGAGVKDEREGCRSLICDANGIIIAEMVYRCMICSAVADSIADAKIHYHNNHIDNDVENGGSCSDPLMFPDEELSMDLSSEEEDHHLSHSYAGVTGASSGGPRSGSAAAAQHQHHHHHQHHNQHHSHNSSDSLSNMVGYRNDEDFKPSGGTSGAGGRKKISRKPAANDPIPNVKIQTSGTNGTCTIKSGYITCPVCSCTKFYTTLQRRYGQFSCVGCYRFFKEFFVKPKRYGCPNLGSCPLDVRTKCKGCWIKKCIDTYSVDEQRKSLLMAHRPVKKGSVGKSPTTRQQQQQHQQQQQPGGNSHVNNSSSGNNSISSPVNDSSNENIEPEQDGLDEEEEEDGVGDGGGHGTDSDSHYHQGPPEVKKIKTEPCDMMESTMNGTEEDEENNSLEDGEEFVADDTENEGSSLLLPATSAAATAAAAAAVAAAAVSYDSASMLEAGVAVTPPTRSGKTPPRRKTSGRIKNWCCLKCANCLADDCGKCINCLDRPKFGGPFIRKQRCLYKKCLMKTKPIPNNSSF